MVRFDEEQFEYIMSNLEHCPYAMSDHDVFIVMEMLKDYRDIYISKKNEEKLNNSDFLFINKSRLIRMRHDDIDKCRAKEVDILSPESTKSQFYSIGKIIGRIELLNDLISD